MSGINKEQFESVMLNASIKSVLAQLDMVESKRDFGVDDSGNLECIFVGEDINGNKRTFKVAEEGSCNWVGSEL